MCRLADNLMHPPGDADYYKCAYGGCANDGYPLVTDEVEISQQGHSGRDEKESEIAYKEVGYAGYMTQTDDAELERKRQQKHPYDA